MGLSTLGIPGYSWIIFPPYLSICAVWSWFSRVMVSKVQERRTPNSRREAEEIRKDRMW